LKSDPVTFTAEQIGWYAVQVNANDVAVMGGRPAWFQPTILVPPGTRPRVVMTITLIAEGDAQQVAMVAVMAAMP
jgi:hydrogenase maturation factor